MLPRCPWPCARRLAVAVALCIAGAASAEPPLTAAADTDAGALRELARQAAWLEENGQRAQALGLLRELARRNDEQRQAERGRMAVALRERFAIERQNQQLERLRLDAERREAERGTQVATQRLTVALGVTALLACAVLAQWLLLSRRRLRLLRGNRALLQERSARDPLTQLFNRGHAQQLLDDLEAQGVPQGAMLLLLDVDHFKHINDSGGHPAGDAVLQELARRLGALVRDGDLVARWGGEEFLLLLKPGASDAGALTFSERLLAAVAGSPCVAGLDRPLTVTVSVGVARWPAWPQQPWSDALERADAALYRAKAAGRNRALHVQLDGPDAAPRWTEVLGPAVGSRGGEA